MKKKHVARDLNFEEKRQEALENKLGARKFIRINTSKEGYDADYEANRTQTFIIKFRDRQLKNQTKNKTSRRQNKRIKTSINKSKCLKWIVKKILPTL